MATFRRVLKGKFTFPDDVEDSNARDLIRCLLCVDVGERLGCGPDGADEIRRHPWFTRRMADDVMAPAIDDGTEHDADPDSTEVWQHAQLHSRSGNSNDQPRPPRADVEVAASAASLQLEGDIGGDDHDGAEEMDAAPIRIRWSPVVAAALAAPIDWDALRSLRVPAPWVPQIDGDDDTRHFEACSEDGTGSEGNDEGYDHGHDGHSDADDAGVAGVDAELQVAMALPLERDDDANHDANQAAAADDHNDHDDRPRIAGSGGAARTQSDGNVSSCSNVDGDPDAAFHAASRRAAHEDAAAPSRSEAWKRHSGSAAAPGARGSEWFADF